MSTVAEVAVKYGAKGTNAAVRADQKVRDSVTETAKTAQQESGTISRWMERHKTAIASIGAATAGVMGAIVSASPTMRSELAGVRTAFSLFADTVVNDVLPEGSSLTDMAFGLEEAYSNLSDPVRETVSQFLIFGGIAGAIVASAAALSKVVAGIVGILGSQLVVAILAVVGAAAILMTAWEENWLGIRDLVTDAVDRIEGAIRSFWDWLEPKARTALETVRGVFRRVFDFIRYDIIGPVLDSIMGVWETHGDDLRAEVRETWDVVQEKINTVIEVVKPIITGFVNIVTQLWDRFGGHITGVARFAFNLVRMLIETAMDAVLTAIRVALAVIRGDWSEAWEIITGFLDRTLGRVKEIVSDAIDSVEETISGLVSWMTTAGKDLIANIVEAISNKISDLDEKVTEVKDAITDPIEGMIDDALTWGKDLIDEFISGIENKIPDLDSAAEMAREKVEDFISFDRVSNDRDARRWGRDMIEEKAKGVMQAAPTLEAAVRQPELAPQPSPTGGGGGGSTTIVVEQHIDSGGSPKRTADKSAEAVSQTIRDEFESRR